MRFPALAHTHLHAATPAMRATVLRAQVARVEAAMPSGQQRMPAAPSSARRSPFFLL